MKYFHIATIAVGLLVSAIADASGADFCPGAGGIYKWTQVVTGMSGNGDGPSNDAWWMSPCAKAKRPGYETPTYVVKVNGSDYSSGWNFSNITSDWERVYGGGDANIQYGARFYAPDVESWIQITVTCDSNVAPGTVVANGRGQRLAQPNVDYSLPVKMNCGSHTPAPPPPPVPSFCPRADGIFEWTQVVAGLRGMGDQPSNDAWWMSPCARATRINHDTPTYMVKVNGTDYDSGWNFRSITSNWERVYGGGEDVVQYGARFHRDVGSWIQVNVTCDSNVAPGKVVANGRGQRLAQPIIDYSLPVKMNCDGDHPCESFTTCESCTESASKTCGWCAASQRCQDGNFRGPTSGTCPSYWEWSMSQCTTPPPEPRFCPGAGGIYKWTQVVAGMSGNGDGPSNDAWWMSPCAKAKRPGYETPTYVVKVNGSDYSSGWNFSNITSDWERVYGGGDANIQYGARFYAPDVESWIQITVTCDSNVAPGTVVANGRGQRLAQPNVDYSLPVKMNC